MNILDSLDPFFEPAPEDSIYSFTTQFFHDCNALNNRLELFLDKESESLRHLFAERPQYHTNTESDFSDDSISEYDIESYRIENLFPYITRSSLFLSCYAFFENVLQEICKLYEPKSKCQIKLKEITGKGIHRSYIFLKKVVGVQFPDDEPEWNELKFYNDIRNLIAHGAERINEKDSNHQQLFAEIKKKTSIKIDNGIFTLNKEFVGEAIKTMNSLIKKLHAKMPDGF